MSAEKLLFNFSRALPVPFDSLPGGKKVKVASKYTSGKTEATISATVTKAVLAFCKCKTGEGLGAVGRSDTKIIAEYKSGIDEDTYHLVVYDPGGALMAGVYDKNTENIAQYTLGPTKMDGAAIMLAIMPELLSDAEFKDAFEAFFKAYQDGFSNLSDAAKDLGMLCDNAYRRIKDESCPAHIKTKIDTGNITRISRTHLDAEKFIPNAVDAGEFAIFSQPASVPVFKPVAAIDNSTFCGQYTLNPARILSVPEQQMVPVLNPCYILPPEIVGICEHAQKTTGKATQMRNFLLRGPAGTGKTAGAKAIAAGLGLPYMKYTCSANTEVFDFVGCVFPETDSATTGDAQLDKERELLKTMGGITYENVAKLLNLPDLEDMDYDPAGVFQKLTGTDRPEATSQECMSLVLNLVADKIRKLSCVKTEGQHKGQTFTYVETDFIKALKNGYLIEVQEPSTIMQPGVLVGLNSLLEQEGSITLPTGEIINRHPDAVVVVTTNINYEGCRGINQSVLDRMSLVADIELPSPEVMTQRAMSVTGEEDDIRVSQMVQVVNDMADFCRKNGITDGAVGMRSLMDWIISTQITDDPYASALITVVSKATSNEEDRNALIASVLEPMFAPKRRRAFNTKPQ